MNEERRVVAQLKNESGELLGSTFDLPLSVTAATLQQICNALLQQVSAAYIPHIECLNNDNNNNSNSKIVVVQRFNSVLLHDSFCVEDQQPD